MILLWDASALVKRYVPEEGSENVDLLFEKFPSSNMATTLLTYSEICSILLRKFNGDKKTFTKKSLKLGLDALRYEVIENSSFQIIPVDDDLILSGVPLISKHNLNSSDATVLEAFRRLIRLYPGEDFICVTSDKRMFRAAMDEGIRSYNPELQALPTDMSFPLQSDFDIFTAPSNVMSTEISSDLLQKVKGHLRSTTLEDSEQIVEIRGRINDETYNISSMTIAEDIVRTLKASG